MARRRPTPSLSAWPFLVVSVEPPMLHLHLGYGTAPTDTRLGANTRPVASPPSDGERRDTGRRAGLPLVSGSGSTRIATGRARASPRLPLGAPAAWTAPAPPVT